MSHSAADAERTWDFGMVDEDVVAFPVCHRVDAERWSTGQLSGFTSYWLSRDRIRWKAASFINFVRVAQFRSVGSSRAFTKGVTEGSETSIGWDAVVSTREGLIERISGGRVTVRRDSDGHRYTWSNPKGLPVVVREGQRVQPDQLIASVVQPLDGEALICSEHLPPGHVNRLIHSRERTQRFTGIKLARLRGDSEPQNDVRRIEADPEEDIYVRLEAAAFLTRVLGTSAREVFGRYLEHRDEQIQLEAVVALAEAATSDAVGVLSDLLAAKDAPYFKRSAAAWALGEIGSEAAIDRLVHAFADVDVAIREEALEAIGEVASAPYERLTEGVLSDDDSIAAGSAEALRRLAPLSPDARQRLVGAVEAGRSHPWAVWLLGTLPRHDDSLALAIAELQETNPEAHYAITLLWTFVTSWVAQRWELTPGAEPVEYREVK